MENFISNASTAQKFCQIFYFQQTDSFKCKFQCAVVVEQTNILSSNAKGGKLELIKARQVMVIGNQFQVIDNWVACAVGNSKCI